MQYRHSKGHSPDLQQMKLTAALVLIEIKVRRGLARAEDQLTGLYEGQPTRTTDRPTRRHLLKAAVHTEITLIRLEKRNHSV